MYRAEMQGGLFANFKEWHIQAAERSDKSSTVLQKGRFADGQE